jgi:uncharacterized protein YneF (UPF0154 family)
MKKIMGIVLIVLAIVLGYNGGTKISEQFGFGKSAGLKN